MIRTRGIVEAGAEYRVPAGLFQGMTLESVSGPAFEFTENGAPVSVGQAIGAGVVMVRRLADGSSDDSGFVLSEPDGTGGGSAGPIRLRDNSYKTLGPYAESDPTTGVRVVGVEHVLTADRPTTLAAVAIRMGQLTGSAEPTLTFYDSLGKQVSFIAGRMNGEWMEYLLPEPYPYSAGDLIALALSGGRAVYTGPDGTQTVGDWTSQQGMTLGLRLAQTTVTAGQQKGVVGPLDFTDFPVVTDTSTVPAGGTAIWKPSGGGVYLIHKVTAAVRVGVKLEAI